MNREGLITLSNHCMNTLCRRIPSRSVGSPGNRQATGFFLEEVSSRGFETEAATFNVLDWHDGGASLKIGSEHYEVLVSPYSLGCSVSANLAAAGNLTELENTDLQGKIILLHGEIAREQLMPKNFVFYNPEEHKKIVSALERSGVLAIICATGRNAALAGGVYPFPLIEDGDFNIPSVYMTEEEGKKILSHLGEKVYIESYSERIPGIASNIIARKGSGFSERMVITAHIDAKKGTPGALDNATGVTILLLLAELLRDYSGNKLVELVALNGEDYYSAPGQMNYIKANQNLFDTILLNINIDGAGYLDGDSAFSFFTLPDEILQAARTVFSRYSGLCEGPEWYQGDHSIFIQQGRPAIAFTSRWFLDNMESQTITHTPEDNLSIVDSGKLAEIAEAIRQLIDDLN
ncbi:MAG: M28 family peptidase [Bacillota bacterium]|nr:M28 family peptidase [Bacillota bacterium]